MSTSPSESEKNDLIEAVQRVKALMATGDVAEIRAYLMKSQGSNPEAAEAFTKASDQEIKAAAAEMASNVITDAELRAESTEWDVRGNIATITIHRSPSEEVEFMLRKVDGAWL